MPSANSVFSQINKMIVYLVQIGYASDQNFAILKAGADGLAEVTFPGAKHAGIALKDRNYPEIYNTLASTRSFNIRMLDGALIQMLYTFGANRILSHRLAFFPSYDLEEFQNNAEIYLAEEIYADVVARSIVPFPVRFDYSADETLYKELEHPKSHLTLGQYENCRIPVTGPMSPFWFMDFLLRNFYHTAFVRSVDKLPKSDDTFENCISLSETGVVHLRVPA